MKRNARLSAMAAAALLSLAGQAAADDPVVKFERYRLANGLEVVLHQDNRVPLVAVDVWYHVGSGDETPGKSGFAHLFEHMLFQGSKHVGDDRHFDILKKIGGSAVNGSTNPDRTNYYEVVPSHQLETALWLESDRMGYFLPKLTETSFKNQIEVVRNERRQRYDNVPYGRARFAVAEALYPEGHPYRYLTIGRHEDLSSSTVEDVTGFYKKWYVPGNATLVVAGDFDMAAARKLIDRWFGTFPTTEKPAHKAPPTPVIKRTRGEVKDPFAKLRRIEYVWHTPAFFTPGDAEMDILSEALASPGTGRLYKILVHEKQLAQSVASFQASQQFSSYFTVNVVAKTDADLAEIERILDQELDRVRAEPISQREFDRSVINREASFVWGLESLLSRAEQLQAYNHYVGTPDYISRDLDRYRKSSPAKVQATAKQFLDRERRVEVLTSPAGPAGNDKGK
ncbi:MAG TPA: pitrilysin family protein [Kofleriaceae bacterium]|nr:pitrilysin family protein [Kofleriaceae bacterium]